MRRPERRPPIAGLAPRSRSAPSRQRSRRATTSGASPRTRLLPPTAAPSPACPATSLTGSPGAAISGRPARSAASSAGLLRRLALARLVAEDRGEPALGLPERPALTEGPLLHPF